MFSAKAYEQETFSDANLRRGHVIDSFENSLTARTAPLAAGADAVCIFVNDTADREVLESLAALGVRHVALRCAGFRAWASGHTWATPRAR